jgi:hypothetical protein
MVFGFNFALLSHVGSYARTKLSLPDNSPDESHLRCSDQKTIAPPQPVSKPQRRKQRKPRKNHEKQGQERVPHLAGFLALPRKKMDEERLGDP